MAAKVQQTPSKPKERARKRELVVSGTRSDWLKPLIAAMLDRAQEDARQIRAARAVEKDTEGYQRAETLKYMAQRWHNYSAMTAKHWKPQQLRDDFLDWIWTPQFALISDFIDYDIEHMRTTFEQDLGVTRI